MSNSYCSMNFSFALILRTWRRLRNVMSTHRLHIRQRPLNEFRSYVKNVLGKKRFSHITTQHLNEASEHLHWQIIRNSHILCNVAFSMRVVNVKRHIFTTEWVIVPVNGLDWLNSASKQIWPHWEQQLVSKPEPRLSAIDLCKLTYTSTDWEWARHLL